MLFPKIPMNAKMLLKLPAPASLRGRATGPHTEKWSVAFSATYIALMGDVQPRAVNFDARLRNNMQGLNFGMVTYKHK